MARADNPWRPVLGLGWVLLSLILTGCGGQQAPVPPEATNGPRTGSSGSGELAEVLRQAGLPESFAFGGRTWRAHQVHRVGASGSKPATGDTTGKPGETTPAGDETAAAASERGGNAFAPVADLQVEGHQIYHREDVDEAVTDNIYLKAGMPAAAEHAGAISAGLPTTGDQPVRGTAFVEYDAAGETLSGMALPEIMKAAGLPSTVQHGGKSWTAREIQRYDADLFDEFKRLPQPVQGYSGYQGGDEDRLYLQAEMTASRSGGGASQSDATAAGAKETLFIRYEPGNR